MLYAIVVGAEYSHTDSKATRQAYLMLLNRLRNSSGALHGMGWASRRLLTYVAAGFRLQNAENLVLELQRVLKGLHRITVLWEERWSDLLIQRWCGFWATLAIFGSRCCWSHAESAVQMVRRSDMERRLQRLSDEAHRLLQVRLGCLVDASICGTNRLCCMQFFRTPL